MSLGEELFLALVVTSFTSFGVLLAILAWSDARYGKSIDAAVTEKAQSGVLLAPQPGSADTAHPFKLSTASTPTIANFQTSLNTWITVEVSEH